MLGSVPCGATCHSTASLSRNQRSKLAVLSIEKSRVTWCTPWGRPVSVFAVGSLSVRRLTASSSVLQPQSRIWFLILASCSASGSTQSNSKSTPPESDDRNCSRRVSFKLPLLPFHQWSSLLSICCQKL